MDNLAALAITYAHAEPGLISKSTFRFWGQYDHEKLQEDSKLQEQAHNLQKDIKQPAASITMASWSPTGSLAINSPKVNFLSAASAKEQEQESAPGVERVMARRT